MVSLPFTTCMVVLAIVMALSKWASVVSPPKRKRTNGVVVSKWTEVGDQVLHVPQLQEVDQTMLVFDIDIIVIAWSHYFHRPWRSHYWLVSSSIYQLPVTAFKPLRLVWVLSVMAILRFGRRGFQLRLLWQLDDLLKGFERKVYCHVQYGRKLGSLLSMSHLALQKPVQR